MENTTFILVLSGLLAGSVNFFVNYLELPMPKAALAEDGDQWPKLKTIWIAMVGYAVVGVAGSMLTPLIDAILGGLKGLEIADGVPKSSQYALWIWFSFRIFYHSFIAEYT